jgi:multidrug efflux pump subunit AcrA (membrane-fusion protein)
VPTAALIFRRDGLELAKVVDGDKARMVHVVIGEDDGATVQIVDGLHPGDKIIQDPPDSLIDGEKVDVVQPGSMPSPAGEL